MGNCDIDCDIKIYNIEKNGENYDEIFCKFLIFSCTNQCYLYCFTNVKKQLVFSN